MSANVLLKMKNERLRLVHLGGLLLITSIGVMLWYGIRRPEVTPSSSLSQDPHSLVAPTNTNAEPPQDREQRSQNQPGDGRQLTTKQVFTLSSRVVFAKCRNVTTRRESNGNIFTFYDFETISVIKGPPGESFTVRLLGGRIGNTEISSGSIPSFKMGEEVVLFLGRQNREGYPTVFPQGVFRVGIDPASKVKFVNPKPTDLRLFNAQTDKPYEASPNSLSLDDFLLSLRKLK
jgi:hypothetical protein